VSRAATRAAAACVLCLTAALVLVPSRASARGPSLPVGLGAAALYVPATGQTLYADHDQVERPIASTTKMMTALVTLEHEHDLETILTYPDYHQAADDSQIGLRPGDRMTVRDLLIAMMLPSADDAAEDLADNVGHGSVPRFIDWMNEAARRLGAGRLGPARRDAADLKRARGPERRGLRRGCACPARLRLRALRAAHPDSGR
jgi:D-alanyl-D-alanine carboxypeptidase (penicillin-binding protein 5/6)